jgi:hypothetical protein
MVIFGRAEAYSTCQGLLDQTTREKARRADRAPFANTIGKCHGDQYSKTSLYSPSCTKNIHNYFLKFSALVGTETCVAS